MQQEYTRAGLDTENSRAGLGPPWMTWSCRTVHQASPTFSSSSALPRARSVSMGIRCGPHATLIDRVVSETAPRVCVQGFTSQAAPAPRRDPTFRSSETPALLVPKQRPCDASGQFRPGSGTAFKMSIPPITNHQSPMYISVVFFERPWPFRFCFCNFLDMPLLASSTGARGRAMLRACTFQRFILSREE
jgi:hypothetical protein